MNRLDSGASLGPETESPDFQSGTVRLWGKGQATWNVQKGRKLQNRLLPLSDGQLFKGWMPQGASAQKLLPPAGL